MPIFRAIMDLITEYRTFIITHFGGIYMDPDIISQVENERPWYKNPTLTPYIQSALKRSNQRMATLIKTFGKDSPVVKHEIGKFKKRGYSDWLSTSVGGKKHGRNISAGGNVKFDVRSINQAIRSGSVSRSEINRFLADAAGIIINPDGSVRELKGGGIQTPTKVLRKTEKKLMAMGEDPTELSKKELIDITEQLAEFSESFDTTYDAFKNKIGIEEGKTDPTIGQLWGERDHRLTYKQLQEIKNAMEKRLRLNESDATKFEADEQKKQAEIDEMINNLTR